MLSAALTLVATAAAAPAPLFPAAPVDDGGGGVFLPALALAVLAALAWFLSRRKRQAGGRLEVLESTSLGFKRSIVLVRVQDEILVVGSSEAGLSLLSRRPAGDSAFDDTLAKARAEGAPLPLDTRRSA